MLTITVPSYAPVYAPDRFKQVFRRYPAGVVVVTADSGRGPVGFTATSLTSLSLDPPLVSYGIGVAASSWPHVEAAASTVVNFLGADQESLARTFATSGIDRFAAPTAWRRLPEGEPVLDGGPAGCAWRPSGSCPQGTTGSSSPGSPIPGWTRIGPRCCSTTAPTTPSETK